MTADSPSDLNGTLDAIWVYPIKSCAGLSLREAELTDTGLAYDRAWMVVDSQGEFVSQRELPRMALIQPSFKLGQLVLRAPGMLSLHLALDAAEGPARVRVWDDEVDAFDMGDTAAQWFSDFLGADAPAHLKALRLIRFDPEARRRCDPRWTGDDAGFAQFADGFSLLVASQASLDELNARLGAAGQAPVDMRRFRPNLVIGGWGAHDEDRCGPVVIGEGESSAEIVPVKPCSRCPIPDIDPDTATPGHAVGDALRTYRQDARVGGAITFGMNAIVRRGDGVVLRVGQPVRADLRFD